MRPSEIVYCPGCNQPFPVPLDESESEVGCPNCCAILEVEKVLEECEGEGIPAGDGSAIDPGNDAASIGKSSRPASTKGRLLNSFFFLVFSSTLAAGGFAYWALLTRIDQLEVNARRLEEKLENQSITQSNASLEEKRQLDEIGGLVESMDSTVGILRADVTAHESHLLQVRYDTRSLQRDVLRQESRLGDLALQLASIEHTVHDRTNEARIAHELQQKRRSDVEVAAKPIRERIKVLEKRKTELLAKHHRLSAPRRPSGVVSSKRASSIMNDWNRALRPTLDQLESEIEDVRMLIDAELSRIDDLYTSLKSPVATVTPEGGGLETKTEVSDPDE